MNLLTAFKGFFTLLGHSEKAQRIKEILQGEEPRSVPPIEQSPSQEPQVKQQPIPSEEPRQSEAITLLAALQREARFLDFVKESFDGYAPEEIGVACSSVHDGCAAVLERFFEIRPLSETPEGEIATVNAANPAQCTLSGRVDTAPPWRGTVVHAGWVAKKCELPKWSGHSDDVSVLTPYEIEIS